jgi:outer membrane protein
MKLKALFFFSIFFVHDLFAQEEVPLQQVIKLALEKNFDVRVAETNARTAFTDRDLMDGAFLPQVNAVGTTVWNDNHQELRFQDENRNNTGDARSNNSSASLQVAWTLFDGTRMFAARNRIITTDEQARFQLKEQMVNTIASVIGNYYDIVRQKQQLRAIIEQMSLNEERVKLAERRLQVGVGAKPELLQARVDYNALRTQALQQEAVILQLKEQLNGLVDLGLPTPFDVADTILVDMNISPDAFLEDIENSNYGLQAAKRNVAAAQLSVRERRAEAYPWLNFNASYNYSRLENMRLINPFGPLFSLTNGFNYGFTLNIPILNNFSNKRVVQQAMINSQRQQILYEQQRVAVKIELRNAYVNYENAKKILLVEEENIALAKENVAIAFEVYKRGAATFVELRTAQQSLADAYTRLINARYLTKLAETELLRLNGSLLK